MRIFEILKENDDELDKIIDSLRGSSWNKNISDLYDSVKFYSKDFNKRINQNSSNSLIYELYNIRSELSSANMLNSSYMKRVNFLIHFLEETSAYLPEKKTVRDYIMEVLKGNHQ
jgi:hypothetical protein